jgi:hypothetical protein
MKVERFFCSTTFKALASVAQWLFVLVALRRTQTRTSVYSVPRRGKRRRRDLSYVHSAAREGFTVVLTKSTVPVGTG